MIISSSIITSKQQLRICLCQRQQQQQNQYVSLPQSQYQQCLFSPSAKKKMLCLRANPLLLDRSTSDPCSAPDCCRGTCGEGLRHVQIVIMVTSTYAGLGSRIINDFHFRYWNVCTSVTLVDESFHSKAGSVRALCWYTRSGHGRGLLKDLFFCLYGDFLSFGCYY